MSVVKALADENRVRVLMALHDRELCVCEIIELLGLAPSTVSKHLSIMYQAELIEYRKDGRWVYYRLANGKASTPASKATEWVYECLAHNTTILKDRNDLEEIHCAVSAQLTCSKGIKSGNRKRKKGDV